MDELIRAMNKIKDAAKNKDIDKIERKAAKVMVEEMRSQIPQSKKPHHRYSKGKIVATYYPGNLRRSIGVIRLKNSFFKWIGPRKSRNSKGEFKGSKVDGYYANFVEYGLGKGDSSGKGFARKSYENKKDTVRETMINGLRDLYKKYIA